MKKLHFLIVLNSAFLIFNSFCFAQNRNVDSLLTLIKTDKPDTSKVNHLCVLTQEYGSIGAYEEGLNFGMSALELAEKLDFKKGISAASNSIGNFYLGQANYPRALSYYLKALKLNEEINNKSKIACQLGNIGLVYQSESDYSKALEYFFRALEMAEKLGDKKGMAVHLANIGIVYWNQLNYPKALNYNFKALHMAEELGEKQLQANTLSNIGIVYNSSRDFSKALDYYFRTLQMAVDLGDKQLQAIDNCNIGTLYLSIGKFKKAEDYLKRSVIMNEGVGANDYLSSSEEALAQLYDSTGQYKLALIHYKKSIALKDTIFSQENKKQLVRKEMNYEFDKKEAITKAENEKQQAVAEEKNHKQKIVTGAVTGGLLLVIFFAGFIFRSLRITRKQKQIIEIKNTETEHQKKIIEEANKDITDSIRYAKRIQDALMGEKVHVSMHLPEHFILFMPKDIVSGDFHWGFEKQGYWYFAAVDCTGHGVPGAVMSMLGISFLNDIVSAEGSPSPAEILNRLRDKVVKELRQTGEAGGSKDGMDISLCRLELPSPNGEGVGLRLQWAGANNALNLIRNGQFKEVKADKQPIGYHPEMRPFTNNEMQLQKGDSIYIYSDGYADQFGGPNGKKFKYKQLEDLITTNNHLPMNDQKEILKKGFIDWKGSLEQIDDVCVFGVRI